MLHTSLEIFLKYSVSNWSLSAIRSLLWTFFRTLLEDGETKDIFCWVDECERWIFFVLHELKFEGFSFQVDDPAHFCLLLYRSNKAYQLGGRCASIRHILSLFSGYFSAWMDICRLSREFRSNRSTLELPYSSPPRTHPEQSYSSSLGAPVSKKQFTQKQSANSSKICIVMADTLILIFEIGDDFIEILKRECFKNIFLSLVVACYMSR